MEIRNTKEKQLEPLENSTEQSRFLLLAERASRGEGAAIEALVNQTRLKMFAFAYGRLRHYDDAHDAVATALVQVCLHIHEVRHPEKVREWMMSVIRNEVRRLQRRRQAIRGFQELTDSDSPTRAYDNAAILRLDIERALRRLPVNQEQALRLFCHYQLSAQEIASRLGASEGAVKMWLHRGRKHLVKDMQGYEPMEIPNAPQKSTTSLTAATMPENVKGDTAAILHSDLPPELIHSLTNILHASGYSFVSVLTPSEIDLLKWKGGGWTNKIRGKSLLILDERIEGRSALEYLLNLKSDPEHQDTLTCVLYSVAPDRFAGRAYFSAGVDSLVDKNAVGADVLEKRENRTIFPPKRVRKRSMSYTPRFQHVVDLATQEAEARSEQYITAQHLLLALMKPELNAGPDRPIFAGRVLQALGIFAHVVYAEVQQRLQNEINQSVLPSSSKPPTVELSAEAKSVIDLSCEEAQAFGDNFMGTEHLLLGLARHPDSFAADVLAELGITVSSLRKAIQELREQDRNG